MTRYAMVIDLDKCLGCEACITACIEENEVPYQAGMRTRMHRIVTGKFPNVKALYMHRICMHCENPPCVHVCPTGASYRREDGIVLIDYDLCIGCKYCMVACPYLARYTHPERLTPDKCTFCEHLLKKGRQPACVETCPAKARIFGDLDDPTSEVAKIVNENQAFPIGAEYGTRPRVFYVRPR
ncbi:MAG: 4Fe-4S dicluster domain-containing protein [Archaeoglobus sp.]|nr:4Fe-4S dicluster domain-containing protein [Archaeoglobus sp.]